MASRLGFYTSQWLANWYLQGLDHYVKEQLHVRYYIRYMDDMVIFGPNKRRLHEVRRNIATYLVSIGLEMKTNWTVARFVYAKNGEEKGRDLDFLGFRFYRNRTVLRKSLMLRATRTARRKHTLTNARRMMSYIGWFDHSDTYRVYTRWIKPFVNIGKLKRQISNSARRKKCGIELAMQKV